MVQVLEDVDGESFMPSIFARSRSCNPAAVSRTLRQLLERDLVRSSIGESDVGRRVYRLTPKGRRALEWLTARRQPAIATIWNPMRRTDLPSFSRLASDLASRLEDYTEKQYLALLAVMRLRGGASSVFLSRFASCA